jgi:hypothetical protein
MDEQNTPTGRPERRVKRIWPWQLWRAARIARRRERRALTQLAEARESFARERASLVDRYEEALAVERQRNYAIQLEASNKLLELVKVTPMVVSSVNELKDDVSDPKIRTEARDTDAELERVMGPQASEIFQSRRDEFWEEGRESGATEAEIIDKWNAIKNRVIDDSLDAAGLGGVIQ